MFRTRWENVLHRNSDPKDDASLHLNITTTSLLISTNDIFVLRRTQRQWQCYADNSSQQFHTLDSSVLCEHRHKLLRQPVSGSLSSPAQNTDMNFLTKYCANHTINEMLYIKTE